MRHRIGGAALAAIGGALIALAAVLPQWWTGPIHIAGKVIHGKMVYIGLWRAIGCNAGDGSCVGLDEGPGFRLLGLAVLLIAVATVLSAFALTISSWVRSQNTPRFATLSLIGALTGVVTAVVYIVLLPLRFEEIPAGVSAYSYFSGAVVVVGASLLALRQRAPRQVAAEPMDVRELLSTDMLRPANLGPEPKLGRYGAVIGGEPTTAPAPPKFRPLYELEGYQPGASTRGLPGVAPAPASGPYPAPASGPYPTAPAYPGAHYVEPFSTGQAALDAISDLRTDAGPALGFESGASLTRGETVTDSVDSVDSVDPLAEPPSQSGQIVATEQVSALTPAPASWQVEPPRVASPAGALAEPASDLGFDAPTMPEQSLAALATAGSDAPEPPNDSGVFLRGANPAARSPAGVRVPTATTSASLAALAALSKPAVITMAPMAALKLPHPKPHEITVLGPAPPCPHCEEPMGWVEKQRRFYCSTCRVYF
jgi:hypothetical protein